jgi:type II secretory pathway component PulK
MTVTRTASRRRRGFAMLTALALISIVGLGLAAMAALFASEARRSAQQRDDAQLRQLLLAGEVAVRGALGRGEREGSVALPRNWARASHPHLRGRKRTRRGSARVRVTARTGEGRTMSQTLASSRPTAAGVAISELE